MKTAGSSFVLASFAVVFAGCILTPSGESQEYKTSEIRMEAEAMAYGDGETVLQTTLKPAEFESVYLDVGDQGNIVHHIDGESHDAKAKSPVDYRQYETTVSKSEADMPMRVEFERNSDSDGRVDAPDTTATLPANFSIEAPSEGAEFSRENDALTVAISNTSSDADQTVATIAANCLEDLGWREFDGNQVTYEAGTLKKHDPADENIQVEDSCEATISVQRRRVGSVDPAYAGGEFRAVQARNVKVMVTP